jgi:hypothetical protein
MDALQSHDSPEEKKEQPGIGPAAAIIIVVALVALGGAYFMVQEYHRLHTPPVEEFINA